MTEQLKKKDWNNNEQKPLWIANEDIAQSNLQLEDKVKH